MSKIKGLYYFVSLTMVLLIEVATHLLFPKLQAIRWAHSDEFRYVWWIYLCVLLIALILLIINLVTEKVRGGNLPLTLIILALLHTNYVVWTIECSCYGG